MLVIISAIMFLAIMALGLFYILLFIIGTISKTVDRNGSLRMNRTEAKFRRIKDLRPLYIEFSG
jgi:hypothetical protein